MRAAALARASRRTCGSRASCSTAPNSSAKHAGDHIFAVHAKLQIQSAAAGERHLQTASPALRRPSGHDRPAPDSLFFNSRSAHRSSRASKQRRVQIGRRAAGALVDLRPARSAQAILPARPNRSAASREGCDKSSSGVSVRRTSPTGAKAEIMSRNPAPAPHARRRHRSMRCFIDKESLPTGMVMPERRAHRSDADRAHRGVQIRILAGLAAGRHPIRRQTDIGRAWRISAATMLVIASATANPAGSRRIQEQCHRRPLAHGHGLPGIALHNPLKESRRHRQPVPAMAPPFDRG